MKIKSIKKVCVIGAGLMGSQIALNNAIYGYEVNVTDACKLTLEKVSLWANKYLNGRVEKGKLIEEEAEKIRKRFNVCENLEDAAKDADLVIEAIIEDEKIKEELFSKLNSIVREDTIIATNSSRMVSSLFIKLVKNPSRLANLHYFNPALNMKLVEVVQGEHTSKETVNILMEFCERTGKKPIWVRKEIDGFIVNRVVDAIFNEALFLLEEEIASHEDIDIAIENGLNHPMGPFKLMDFVGLDLLYLISERKIEITGKKPNGHDVLKDKFNNGKWGMKKGQGFYNY